MRYASPFALPLLRGLSVGLVCALTAVACSSDSSSGGAATGGSAGENTGGAGAAPGGNAGSSGAAGSAQGGSAGSAGQGGTAGSAQGGSAQGGSAAGGSAGFPSSVPSGPSVVRVSGYQLLVQHRAEDGSLQPEAAYDMRGISYNPVPKGENHDGQGRIFKAAAALDLPLMRAAHINTIKTYDPPERSPDGIAALDQYYLNGIKVVLTVLPGYDSDYVSAVNYFKNHPAVLMWVVGNEWNYNHLYSDHTDGEVMARLQEASRAIHALDPNHPVATNHGEVPSAATLAAVSDPDLWALNLYPSLSFGDRFTRWQALSDKPMFVGEYGADAYNKTEEREDQTAQAHAIELLTDQIRAQLSARDANHVVVGGCPYAFSDEWWKSGNPAQHDSAGFDNPGVYPDGHATEEWWGIVDIDRTPREAYSRLAGRYAP